MIPQHKSRLMISRFQRMHIWLWALTFHLAIVPTWQTMNVPGFIGCYKDCNRFVACTFRALSIGEIKSEDQSSERCFKHCLKVTSDSYRYAGLENGDECFCGNSINGQAEKTQDSECTTTCKGDGNQICGASHRISLYEISQGVCSNDIGPPTNGDHTINNPRSLDYNLNNFKFFRTRVDFSCDVGYTLHGASFIECIDTGFNNVTWSDSVPTCMINSSSADPPSSTEAERNHKTTSEGQVNEIDGRKRQLQTGTIVGIAVGVTALIILLAVVVGVCQWKKRAKRETRSVDNVAMATVESTFTNVSYEQPEVGQPSTALAMSTPPMYSQVAKKPPAGGEVYATADDVTTPGSMPCYQVAVLSHDDEETGWVENTVYGCESFPIELPNNPLTMEKKPN